MKKFFTTIKNIFSIEDLRVRILNTLGLLVIFRLGSYVVLPGIDPIILDQIASTSGDGKSIFDFINTFLGGAFSRASVFALGIMPYISASIVVQLLTVAVPYFQKMQKEGESGRKRISQITRVLTIAITGAQGFSYVVAAIPAEAILEVTLFWRISSVIILIAGTMFCMWIGEKITDKGIGNGISMILFAGIMSQLPRSFAFIFDSSTDQAFIGISFFVVFFAIIALIVYMNEAVRKITIRYAKRTRGSRVTGGETSHLPIKVNVAGVMPIIFAVSIMLVPSFIARLLVASSNPKLIEFGNILTVNFTQTSPVYMILYFIIVFFFTFFSALIFFNAGDISDELKKSGAFISGIRPGAATKKYLEFVVTRITLVGALFLGIIAILPSLAQIFTGVGQLAISGTSILIVVSVVLETYKQVESMLVEQNYDRFL